MLEHSDITCTLTPHTQVTFNTHPAAETGFPQFSHWQSYNPFLSSALVASTLLPSSCGNQQEFHLPNPQKLGITELRAKAGFEIDS